MVMTREEFFNEAPAHLVKAVKEGKAAFYEGEVYTLANLGVDTANLVEGSVDNAVKLYEQEARIAALEAELARFKADPETHSELIEALIPDSKTGFERLTVDALQKVAKYRGLATEGKDKAALVTDLLNKQEGK